MMPKTLTKRDWFAGMALQGILASTPYADLDSPLENIAQACYEYADAMLEARF